MMESPYNIIKDTLRTLPRIAKWLFFEEEHAVMWSLFTLFMAVSVNLMVYSFLQASPIKEFTDKVLAVLSPVWLLIIYRFTLPWSVGNEDRLRLEFIKKFGKLADTARLKRGWLVGIYEINRSFYVVPLEEVKLSEWRKFENLFKELRQEKEAYSLEATKRLLSEF